MIMMICMSLTGSKFFYHIPCMYSVSQYKKLTNKRCGWRKKTFCISVVEFKQQQRLFFHFHTK